MKVVLYEEDDARSIIGVMDGKSPLGVENENDKMERKEFLRKIGYKFLL